MPLQGAFTFSYPQARGCFLAPGCCCRGLSCPHSFMSSNLTSLSATGTAGYPCLSLHCSAKQPLFPNQGPFLAPAVVSGNWVWPRDPGTLLCCFAGDAKSSTPPQGCLPENFIFVIYWHFFLLWEKASLRVFTSLSLIYSSRQHLWPHLLVRSRSKNCPSHARHSFVVVQSFQ